MAGAAPVQIPGQSKPVATAPVLPGAAPLPVSTGAFIPAQQSSANPMSYTEPVTGTPQAYPTANVPSTVQYQTAASLQSQKESEMAQQALLDQQAKLTSDARSDLYNKAQSLSSTMGAATPVQYGGANDADLKAAQAAAFARAKDQAGLISRSAITGLRDSMAGRGTLGSGIEGEGTANIIAGNAGGLADLNTQQMEDTVTGETHAADEQFQGDLAQRTQQQQALQSLLSLMGGRAY